MKKMFNDRYEILDKIGDGGMAFVYKARCTILNRIVAIKVLRPEFSNDEEFLLKFKNEALASAGLTHPNIVNIYDVGQDEEINYIVMEYVDGMNLKDLIKKKGALDYSYALDIMKQIAMALNQAHKNGIVHRDIKPHNILISEDNVAKVADFGIAKATTSSTITVVGNVIGSVHYFSPEQARGGYIDKTSDLYSLGIVLYEMLTGKVPFRGDTPVNIALKHINEYIDFEKDIPDNIPKDIKGLLYKLTQKKQSDRYQSAYELINDIEYIENNVELDFEQEYDNYHTQKLNSLNEELKANIPKQLKEEGVNTNMRKKSKKKNSSKKKMTILGVLLALVMSLSIAYLIYSIKDLFIVQNYEMPDFENNTLEDATTRLEAIGVDVRIRKELYDSSVEKNHIINQTPSAGSPIKKGQTVKFDVSKGGEPVTVPNLVRKTLESVENILKESDLKEGVIDYEFSSLPEGTIISQKPRAFTEVEQGTGIDFIVSKGEEVKLVKVPNIVGKTLEDARVLLVELGIGKIKYEEDKDKKEGVILRQSLKGGQHVEEGKKIDLTVNEYEEEEEVVEEPSKKIIEKQISFELPQEDETVEVVIKEKEKNTSNTIYNKTINIKELGSMISVPIEGYEGQTKEYEIYVNDVFYGKTTAEFK
ncbi:MAG: Stk1 family PASTA domain-containing Ser/Thr kinase [Tepidibacter sp.]|jgi:serine/threonine-protein kinase|uniref:Stk1 family PASTA domain-containing Ser/Thr kinase n=1 Tax=Tepidibacter sp. TaxID=2529387 RepID=UPI0025E502DA|nr:Stk1 family PASTA domain-containing Ser/Thr kinase [Tepidibacter sp.]MCT4508478.1 Stk1 family PASTA domain-containing Ser/Thr kinase [Tepidibacter sp.]